MHSVPLRVVGHHCRAMWILSFSFRNILVHGYDAIDDRIVWGVIKEDLGSLIEDVARLIG
jgi:uncharacterized protein YutE (UPF0331/DUF86 family)